YPDAGGAGMYALLGRLEPVLAAAHVRVPRALGWAPEERLLIVSEVAGISLEAMLAERPDPALARDAARALTAIQCVAAHPSEPAEAHASVDDFRAQAETLAAALPEAEGRIRKAMRELLAEVPDSGAGTSFNHGDFHPGQLLMGADRIGVLDFERAHT